MGNIRSILVGFVSKLPGGTACRIQPDLQMSTVPYQTVDSHCRHTHMPAGQTSEWRDAAWLGKANSILLLLMKNCGFL